MTPIVTPVYVPPVRVRDDWRPHPKDPQHTGDKPPRDPKTGGDKPKYPGGDKPKWTGDKPKFTGGDKPARGVGTVTTTRTMVRPVTTARPVMMNRVTMARPVTMTPRVGFGRMGGLDGACSDRRSPARHSTIRTQRNGGTSIVPPFGLPREAR